jgi:hypothetical protein
MLNRFSWPLTLGLVALPTGPVPAAADPNEVEVRFNDDSTVRMVILQDSLDVDTGYGKLTVPTREVRRIDFAFRLSEEEVRKIDGAIRNLGDSAFRSTGTYRVRVTTNR